MGVRDHQSILLPSWSSWSTPKGPFFYCTSALVPLYYFFTLLIWAIYYLSTIVLFDKFIIVYTVITIKDQLSIDPHKVFGRAVKVYN